MATNTQKNTRPIIRSQWTRHPVTLSCGPGKTQQHFSDEVDINRIVQRFSETGVLPQGHGQPEYGFASSQTFTEAMNMVAAATQNFMLLPSEVRTHFKNSPAAFLDATLEELQELGLEEKPEVKEPEEPAGTPLPAPPEPTTAPSS